MEKQAFHFYAASCYTWRAEENIKDLLAKMDEEGKKYLLYYVPHPLDTEYDIKFYQPWDVGAVFLGQQCPDSLP